VEFAAAFNRTHGAVEAIHCREADIIMVTTGNAFPLYKVADGINYTLNFKGDRKVKEYLTSQGRFNHLKDPDIDQIQKMVDAEWNLLLRKAGMTFP
jgi:pyruvate/2-oxoacid:ferredoxin oxidoreductase beta subunit